MNRTITMAVAAAAVLALTGCGPDTCSPEARDRALSRDANAVLHGQLSSQAAIDAEIERMELCE